MCAPTLITYGIFIGATLQKKEDSNVLQFWNSKLSLKQKNLEIKKLLCWDAFCGFEGNYLFRKFNLEENGLYILEFQNENGDLCELTNLFL